VVEKMTAHHQLIQYGIRSGTREEFAWMHEHNTRMDNQQTFMQCVEEIANERPVYLRIY